MSGLVRYTFPFGGGVFGQLDLPAEMTPAQAERLKAFVGTLVIGQPEEEPAFVEKDPALAEKVRAVMEEIRSCSPGARLAEVPTLFAFGPIYQALANEREVIVRLAAGLAEQAEALRVCQQGRIGDAEHAGRLLSLLASLRRPLGCWCQDKAPEREGERWRWPHSDICEAAAKACGEQL